MVKKIEIKKEELYKFYIEEGKSSSELEQIFNCSRSTINRKLKEYGLRDICKKNESSKLKDLKGQIKTLYLEGKSQNEISKILRKSGKTIGYHLRNMNIEMRPTKKINQEDFERLWNKGKNDKEIAEYFGVSELTIKTFRTRGKNAGKFNITRYFSQEEHQLSNLQEQMILGSLLGDMSLGNPDINRNENSRLYVVHSIKQEEYFMNKVKMLGEFMGSYRLYEPTPDKRTREIYKTWRGNSKAHKVFTDLYNLLYPNKIKTITKEYLDKINHPIALAYWFMDDGCNDGTIATNSFSYEECILIKEWFKEKWGIECTLQANNSNFVIYISSKSRDLFDNLIKPYIIPSMNYKLKH